MRDLCERFCLGFACQSFLAAFAICVVKNDTYVPQYPHLEFATVLGVVCYKVLMVISPYIAVIGVFGLVACKAPPAVETAPESPQYNCFI